MATATLDVSAQVCEELAARLKDEIRKRQQAEDQLKTALDALRFSQEIQMSCERTMGEMRATIMTIAEGKPLYECDGHPDEDDLIDGLQSDKTELQRRIAELQQANVQLANEAAEYARRAADSEQKLEAERRTSAEDRLSLARIKAAHAEGINRWRSEHPGRAMDLPLTRRELVGWLLAKLAARTDELRIVFDGPPGATSGRFVEVEAPSGRSVSVGEWVAREGGMWELRIARDCDVRDADEVARQRGRAALADHIERTIDEACTLLRPMSGVLGAGPDALLASARSVADLQAKWKKTEAKLQSIRDRQRSIIDNRGSVEIVDVDLKTCGHGYWYEVDGRFVVRIATRYVDVTDAAGQPLTEDHLDGRLPHAQVIVQRPRATDQLTPKHDPSKPDVWAAVIAHASMVGMDRKILDIMRARRQLGIERYGTPLQPWNGRSVERDLSEELLDATVYAAQSAIERRFRGWEQGWSEVTIVAALADDVQFKEILAITNAAVTAP